MSPNRTGKEGTLALSLYALLVTAYFFSFFFRVSASVVLPQEASRLGLSAAAAGFISSLYYYAYAVTQPLCGILHDRFGPLRIVAWGMALTGLGEVLYILSPTTLSLGLWRFLTGLGLAPMFSGALLFQSRAFPQERYPFYAGLTLAAGNFGAVVSVGPLGFALDRWGKTRVFSLLACVSFALAAALVLLGRRGSFSGKAEGRLELRKKLALAARTIVETPPLRSVVLLWSLLISALLAFQGLWAVAWYTSAFGTSASQSRNWATLIGVGVIVGTLSGGRLRGSGASIRFWYGLTGLFWVLLLVLATLTDSVVLVGSAGFLLGLTSGVFVVQGASAVNRLTEPSVRGAVLGMANLFVYVGVIAFQWGTGSLIGLFEKGPGLYGPTGFLVAFGATTLLFLAGGALLIPSVAD